MKALEEIIIALSSDFMNNISNSNEMNNGLQIKYLNIILITLIISAIINSSIYAIFSTSFSWNLDILILIIIILPFIFGGILSGFIKDGKKGVLGGVVVGVISTFISLDLSLLLSGFITLPTSEWSFYIPLGLIFMTPIFMGIGAVLGLIGSIMGILIKKLE